MRFLGPAEIRFLERTVSRAFRRIRELPGAVAEPSRLLPAWNGLLLSRILLAEGFLSGSDLPEDGGAVLSILRDASELFPGILRPAVGCLASLDEARGALLVETVRSLPREVLGGADILSWAHQAWQAERKTAVQRGGRRIGADGLGAVTQLFTDGYMAAHLVARAFAVRRDAAGVLPAVLDPCCGAGSFLLAAMPRLVEARRSTLDGDAGRACDAVLADGLCGLEIDPYCAELAVCCLVLAAWRYPGAGGMRPVPRPAVACPGHALQTSRRQWASAAGGNADLEAGLSALWDMYSLAPVLGSLLEPPGTDLGPLREAFEKALAEEDAVGEDQPAVCGPPYGAGRLLESARLLSRRYGIVATNVPYLNRPKQDERLAAYCALRYPEARRDLSTVFVERCLDLCAAGGQAVLVTPQNWLFLGAYRALRRRLLGACTWLEAARLGEGAFASRSATGAFAALLHLSPGAPPAGHRVRLVDATGARGAAGKAVLLSRGAETRDQAEILGTEDARLLPEEPSPLPSLARYAESLVGLQNGDAPRYVRFFWEVPSVGGAWIPLQGAPDGSSTASGRSFLLRWEGGKGSLASSPQARIQGTAAWGRRGVIVRLMRHLDAALYDGAAYDQAAAVLLPRDPADLPALWAFGSSGALAEEVRRIDGKLNVTNAGLLKAPFDAERWRAEARRLFPGGVPAPSCDDPAQWDFSGDPVRSRAPLHVAVARLLGFRWPAEKDGNGPEEAARPVLPLPACGGEPPAAERLRELLGRSYGRAWSDRKESELVRAEGVADGRLETWLRDGFFRGHLALFRQRPFVWHVWDGRRDGFSVLLLCHALDAARLRGLVDGPLRAWIRERERGARPGDREAADAARALRARLLLVLEGEAPFDAFVRWKPLSRQPIGWEPDWDDGVRANIRPFVEADVLRVRPRIRWEVDRGRDGPEEPWGAAHEGRRRNDVHLRLEEKRAARKAAAGSAQ